MNESSAHKKMRMRNILLGGFFGLILLIVFIFTLKTNQTITKISAFATRENEYQLFDAFNNGSKPFERLPLPSPEDNRKNFLIIGMRGAGKEFGEFLTDTIILISIDTNTKKAAFISIPRDLFVSIPYNGKVKINELYSVGYAKGGERLAFNIIETVVSQITGVYIDGIVRIDFDGFEKLVNAVGGVDVYLEKPFSEMKQWEGMGGFSLPKGWNHLNGQQALFFVRSRFSTSDFDRAERQQIVMSALKEKLASAGVLSNPIKIYSLLDVIGDHVKTDIPLSIPEGISLINTVNSGEITHLVLSTQNFLTQEMTSAGIYILLPKNDTFYDIQQAVKNIFIETPQTPQIKSDSPKKLETT